MHLSNVDHIKSHFFSNTQQEVPVFVGHLWGLTAVFCLKASWKVDHIYANVSNALHSQACLLSLCKRMRDCKLVWMGFFCCSRSTNVYQKWEVKNLLFGIFQLRSMATATVRAKIDMQRENDALCDAINCT